MVPSESGTSLGRLGERETEGETEPYTEEFKHP